MNSISSLRPLFPTLNSGVANQPVQDRLDDAPRERFTPSPAYDPPVPSRADVLRTFAAAAPSPEPKPSGLKRVWDTSAQFVQGVGDQVGDAWEAVTHPRQTYEALKGGAQRVMADPGGAARDVVDSGKKLAEKVKTNGSEENARLLGQNAPIPGLKQMAMLGAAARLSKVVPKSAPPSTREQYQNHLQKLEKEPPDKLKHLDGPRPNAPGSVAAEREAARSFKVHPDSTAIRELSNQQKRLLEDPKNRIDNPKAFTSDFQSNGIHVRPSDGKSHIQYQLKDGVLTTSSKDGATKSQQESARLRLLSDPQFRNQLADQIRSGLEKQPPRDPAARAQAEQFLQYLKSLE